MGNPKCRGLLVGAAIVLIVASACTGDPEVAPAPSAPGTAAGQAPASASSSAPGGCGQTPLRTGKQPDWTLTAGPPDFTPYAVSHEGNLVATLFAHPLRAGAGVQNPANKILWIVREPRHGSDLHLVLQRADGTGDPVEVTEVADSSPGEIYPSIVDVPTAGCWSITATWDNTNVATLELAYT